ncbi:MAG: sugar phosphate nucleotidyltransferase [bacterium]
MLYGIVLAGGRGERFWPLSRAARPKQFLRLTSDRIMLEETISRTLPLIPLDRVRIVTGESMANLVLQNIPSLKPAHLLTEPVGRNTCTAVGLAAVHVLAEDPDAILAVLSADHLIRPAEKLLEIIACGAQIAAEEKVLITIGIAPTRAEVGYGYIRLGEKHRECSGAQIFQVSGFTEKPRPAIAKEYYFSGNYLWNSGMFIWSARDILDAIEQCQPDTSALLKEYAKHIGLASEAEAREELYREVPSVSIDVAVLERASNVLTIKADIIWDDVGDWNALSRYRERNADNNVTVGKSLLRESYETTVYNESEGLVACLGVSDLVVVRSGDITLVVHKTKAQNVKSIIAELAKDEATKKYL